MTVLTTIAQVESISPLTDSIIELILTPQVYIDYQAGQYLQIGLQNEWLSYSIANAPLGAHKYELHIRHDKENLSHQQLFAEIKQKGSLPIRLPMGSCYVEQLEKKRPILFIAGGTGFAPIKGMIEYLLALGDERPFELYWGARSQSDLYWHEKVLQWQTHISHFRYFSLLSKSAKVSLCHLVISQHGHALNDYQIVISGPFDMVFATRDALVKASANPALMYSDAFDFLNKQES